MELILNTIADAMVDAATDGFRAVQTGYVSDIPVQAKSDPYALCRAIFESGGPGFGQEHPYIKGLFVNRIVSRAGASTDDAVVQWTYEGPGTVNVPAVLTVEDNTSLAVETREIDDDGFPIQTIFQYPVVEKDPEIPVIKQIAHKAPIPVLSPRRNLTVSGIVQNRKQPSTWTKKAVGTVNDAPWPTGSLFADDEPLDVGYWLCTGVTATVERARGAPVFTGSNVKANYRVRATFSSKVRQDWSVYAFYTTGSGVVPREPGNVAVGQPTGEKIIQQNTRNRDLAVARLIKGPYKPGQDHSVNAFTKIGPYPTANFPAIFGY